MIKKTIITAALAGVLATFPATAQTLPDPVERSRARSIVVVLRDGTHHHINLRPGLNNIIKASPDGAIRIHLAGAADTAGNTPAAGYDITIPFGLIERIYYSAQAAPADFTAVAGPGNISLSSDAFRVAAGRWLEIPYALPSGHPGDNLMIVCPTGIDSGLIESWVPDAGNSSIRLKAGNSLGTTNFRLLYGGRSTPVEVTVTPPPEYTPGDADSNGRVDVNDIVTTAGYILGQIPGTGIDTAAADVSGDGKVDVTDIVGIANIILSPQTSTLDSRPSTLDSQPSTLHIARYAVDDEGRLWIDCPTEIAGIQFDADGDAAIIPADDLPLTAHSSQLPTPDSQPSARRFLAYTIGGSGLQAGLNHVATLNPQLSTLNSPLILVDRRGQLIPAIETTPSGITDVESNATAVGAPAENPFGATLTLPVTIAGNGSHRIEVTLLSAGGAVAARTAATLGAGSHTVTLDTDALAPGMYIVAVAIDGHRAATHKAIRR